MSVEFPQGFAYGMAQGSWSASPTPAIVTLVPPSSTQSADLRRASSVADVFGLQGQSSTVVMRSPSMVSDYGTTKGSNTSRARFAPPPPRPLFQFRSHEALRNSNKRRQSSVADFNIEDNGDATVKRFQSERRSQVAARALSVRSLSHLVVEPKKATLLLPAGDHDDGSSDQTASDRDDRESEADRDPLGYPPVDDLWREVRANRRQQARSKPSCADPRLRPRWWRHLSLRDFAEFLTPGLFDGDELDASSVSSADDVEPSSPTFRALTGLERDASIAGQAASTRLPSSVSTNSVANEAARSVKRMQVPQRVHPLSIDHSNVSVWTQHVLTRHPNHWTTPRRHAMRNGRSTAELGTQTTVSIRDYSAAFSSLASILSVRERISRLDLGREELVARALLFQEEIFSRWCVPVGDERRSKAPEPVRLLVVVESDLREDLVERSFRELQWIVTEFLLLPSQEALMRRDAAAAMSTFLQILKELSEFDKDAAEEEMKRFFGPESL